MKHNLRSGFTIVELLIVIVVIGILAALVLNSFANAQADARNAQVTSAALAWRKALIAYAQVNGNYFITPNASTCVVASSCLGYQETPYGITPGFETAMRPYIGNIPSIPTKKLNWGDPTDNRQGMEFVAYNYANWTMDGQQHKYWLTYYLEGANKKCTLPGTVGTIGGNYPAFTTQQNPSGATENRPTGVMCVLSLPDPANL